MKNWVFLSKDGQDQYIAKLAASCGGKIVSTDDFVYSDSSEPIILRGILKHKIMKQCWDDSRDFFYMDTGYFGNDVTSSNPNGWKYWHRIVKNDLQHGEIIPRPDDRWKKFNKTIEPWKKDGRKIIVAKPDEKPCKFYGIDLDQWTVDTVNTIKKYTDRPVEVRERAPKREDRDLIISTEDQFLCHPFRFVDKSWIVAQYFYYGIEDLFNLTRSCEGDVTHKKIAPTIPNYQSYKPEMDVPECGTCFWCLERNWALSQLDQTLEKLKNE